MMDAQRNHMFRGRCFWVGKGGELEWMGREALGRFGWGEKGRAQLKEFDLGGLIDFVWGRALFCLGGCLSVQ